MIRRFLIAAAFAVAITASPASAQTQSVYSSTAEKDCKTEGAPASGEHALVTWRCPTPFGFTVVATFPGTSVKIAFNPPGKTLPPQLGASFGIGPKVEWRGSREGGKFVPKAAIVRLLFSVTRERNTPVLGIVRIEGDRVCPAAWVDASSNPDPNGMARAAADEAIAGFSCGTGRAKIVGESTEYAQEAKDRSPF